MGNPENSGIPIPRNITGLTGITDAMVKDAPKFEDIAGDLHSHLEGTVMTAHSSRFDYGFLKLEYKRMGGILRLRTLCTVKLSRTLYPHVQGHSLNAIMQRFGLSTDALHRGMGDVQLMLDFLDAAKRDLGSVMVNNFTQNYILQDLYVSDYIENLFIILFSLSHFGSYQTSQIYLLRIQIFLKASI